MTRRRWEYVGYLIGLVLVLLATCGTYAQIEDLKTRDPAAYERYMTCLRLQGKRCAEVATMPPTEPR